MKNDFTEIIEAGMQSLLTRVEGRDTICTRIFRNERNSCLNLKKNLHLDFRETLSSFVFTNAGTVSSSITRICSDKSHLQIPLNPYRTNVENRVSS